MPSPSNYFQNFFTYDILCFVTQPPPGSSLSWPLAATSPAVKLGGTMSNTTVAPQQCSPIELPTELDILDSIDVDIDGTPVGGDILR